MKSQTKLLLAVAACMPAFSGAMAGPTAATINPSVATTLPTTPLDPQVRRALVPATGPCRAELSMQRVELSRSADGANFNVSVTIANIGSEPAPTVQASADRVLGISIEVTSTARTRMYFGQIADIDIIHPGTSRTFTGTFPARFLNTGTREITARIDRGPDGPRCAYDARANNDGLGVSGPTVRSWLAAGHPSYVRDAPWDR